MGSERSKDIALRMFCHCKAIGLRRHSAAIWPVVGVWMISRPMSCWVTVSPIRCPTIRPRKKRRPDHRYPTIRLHPRTGQGSLCRPGRHCTGCGRSPLAPTPAVVSSARIILGLERRARARMTFLLVAARQAREGGLDVGGSTERLLEMSSTAWRTARPANQPPRATELETG